MSDPLQLLLLAAIFTQAAAGEVKGPNRSRVTLLPTTIVSPITASSGLELPEGTLLLGSAPALYAPVPLPAPIPDIVAATAEQNRLLLAAPSPQKGLEHMERLASFANSPQKEAAQAGQAAALLLGALTAPDLNRLSIESPAYRGLFQSLDPADEEALRATAAVLKGQSSKDAALRARLQRISAKLQQLTASGSLSEVSAQLSQLADNSAAPNKPDISPTFVVSDDQARQLAAAQFLPKDLPLVERAIKGVELPLVLAYKAASIALREDLKGVFSEIGAAQKVSGDFYKIKGQSVIHSSLSPYAREASDQRYSPPGENPASEDYTSENRVKQQLTTEFSSFEAGPKAGKFALATTARTSWGNGHAWLGIRAQLAPGTPPVEVILHVRMLGDRTRNQKDVLGAIGVSALFATYYHTDNLAEFVRGLGDGISKTDFEIDSLSIRMPDGTERAGLAGGLELLRQGFARQILLAPGGMPVAPAKAGQVKKFSRWTLLRRGNKIGTIASPFAAAVPPQDEPNLVRVMTPEEYAAGRNDESWILITRTPETAVAEMTQKLYPAARGKQTLVVSPPEAESKGAAATTEFKAKRLNREAWVKGVFADVGGYQGTATRFFEASNTHSIFDTVSFPSAEEAEGRYGRQDALSDIDFINKQLDFEFARIGDHTRHSKFGIDNPHNKFAIVTHATEKGNALIGKIGLKLEDDPQGATSETVVEFRITRGTWQSRRNALAALGVNLLYASYYRVYPEKDFLRSLREDLGPVQATMRVASSSGLQAQGLGAAP